MKDPYDIPDGEGNHLLPCGCAPYSIWGHTDPYSYDPSCLIHGYCTCPMKVGVTLEQVRIETDPRCPQHGGAQE